MSVHTKKHPIKPKSDTFVLMSAKGIIYKIPRKIANKYRIEETSVSPDDLFAHLNNEFTRPGALLKGIRFRENLTQTVLAKLLKVTQSDVSQMENGSRNIGRKIAKRIEKLFDTDYRSFLS